MKIHDNDQNLIPELRRGNRKYCLQVSAFYQDRGVSYINGSLVRVLHI